MTDSTMTPPTTPGAPEGAKPEGPARPRRAGSVLSGASGLVVLALVLVLAGWLSLMVGSRAIAPGRVIDVLLHPDGSTEATIVRELRVTRTLLAVAVGVALGVAGALMQGHTRNPLADPGLLGVTSGASFGVVVGIYLLGIESPSGYAWFALVGAGGAAAAVVMIGSSRGGPDPVTLVLAGTAVSALLFALTQTIVLRDLDVLDQYRFWVVGSVNGPDLGVLAQVAPFLLLGLLLAAAGSPALNVLQLGDDVARSLGMRPALHKATGVLAVMLLAGGATAACGPVGFVGLVVPHVARRIAGVDFRWLVPYAGVLGALLVVVADTLGRVVVRPAELQVGLVMALVGGPVFVILVRRLRMVRL